MLQIAVCDDVAEQTISLQKYIREYCSGHGMDYELYVYTSGKKLLSDAGKLDIVFLDIEMPGLDGIETGRMVHEKNAFCKIIMATFMVERMKEAFYIEAFRFITKPFSQSEVEEALSASIGRIVGQEKVTLYYNWLTHTIAQREIYYVVAYDSCSEFKIKDKMLRSEDSLNDLEQKLNGTIFFRIHRKYIVNMLYIQSYKNGKVQIDGVYLPVSRRRKKSFEKAYMEFDITYR